MLRLTGIVLSLFSSMGFAQVCNQWSTPQAVGLLNAKNMTESSGLAVSKNFSNRMYSHNDSGGGAYFYQMNLTGGDLKKITLKNTDATDYEDMAIGPCENQKTCLYIANIGDNDAKRSSISVVLLEEVENFATTVNPLKVLQLNYPNGAHNAEAMVVHPNGDLFIFSKESNSSKAKSTEIFTVSKSQIDQAQGKLILKSVGFIDIPYLNKEYKEKQKIITGASISEDGSRFLLLTYKNAFEFSINLLSHIPATQSLVENVDYKKIAFTALEKQEAIAYLPGDQSFYVTSEDSKKKGAPILKFTCQ